MRLGRRETIAIAGVAVALIVAGVYAGLSGTGSLGPHRTPGSGGVGSSYHVLDETSELGVTFHPGVILGAAANDSTVLIGGIGVYHASAPDFTLPEADAVTGTTCGPSIGASGCALSMGNITPLINSYFWEGGIYGVVWNGSAWLIGGQAGWGGGTFGALIALHGNTIDNLTGEIAQPFFGGGIFAIGWNGSAWLIGGNSTGGVSLVALTGPTVTNLSAKLEDPNPDGWIQILQWNGAEWLIGGGQIFETLRGGTFTDLRIGSPFQDNGVFAGDWNGSAWLVGGGGNAKLALVVDDRQGPGPVLPAGFDQVVLFIGHGPLGWLVGGKGSTATGDRAGYLALWSGLVRDIPENLTPELPAPFGPGAEIQFGCPAPMLGANVFLLVGEHEYDAASGFGVGSVALLYLA